MVKDSSPTDQVKYNSTPIEICEICDLNLGSSLTGTSLGLGLEGPVLVLGLAILSLTTTLAKFRTNGLILINNC
jgi:hypothetical protein